MATLVYMCRPLPYTLTPAVGAAPYTAYTSTIPFSSLTQLHYSYTTKTTSYFHQLKHNKNTGRNGCCCP